MRIRNRLASLAVPAFALLVSTLAAAQPTLDRARELLRAGNAKAAYDELAPMQAQLSGQAEFDYLLGVAALDSGRIDEAVIAFERVLAVMPNHAGARMDLARAYYAAGSFDLAAAAFVKLRESNPPPAAQEAIARYLDAIEARKPQTRAGWAGYSELGFGWDSNITAVPTDFGAAAQQSFNLIGIDPTGNSVKRDAPFAQGALGLEYSRPFAAGWSGFAGGEARGRTYHREHDFDSGQGEVHAGASRNNGPDQYRFAGSYFAYFQEGEAPGEPKPTNNRTMAGVSADWRRALTPRTQVGAAILANRVKFTDNPVENFDQVLVSVSWLHSLERKGVPLIYLAAFASNDRAPNEIIPGEDVTKSKRLYGARAYLQYSVSPKLNLFSGVALIHRRDTDAFARSTTVQDGRDNFVEAALGAAWQFREKCAVRLQWLYSRNASNIDIYDFNRNEVSSTVRCDIF